VPGRSSVGADSILADGDILNKAGTALLAWSARGHSYPFYVLSETLKISSRRWSTDREHLADNLSFGGERARGDNGATYTSRHGA